MFISSNVYVYVVFDNNAQITIMLPVLLYIGLAKSPTTAYHLLDDRSISVYVLWYIYYSGRDERSVFPHLDGPTTGLLRYLLAQMISQMSLNVAFKLVDCTSKIVVYL